mgnify:FL=1
MNAYEQESLVPSGIYAIHVDSISGVGKSGGPKGKELMRTKIQISEYNVPCHHVQRSFCHVGVGMIIYARCE